MRCGVEISLVPSKDRITLDSLSLLNERTLGANVIDVLRSYLQMATGIVEATTDKAKDAAASLASQELDVSSLSPDALAAQVQELADDLVEQSRTNREILVGLVKSEVDRTVSRMGFVREEELAAVRKHVQRLEGQFRVGTEQVAGVADLASSQVKAATDQALSAASQAVETAKSTATNAASQATQATNKATEAASQATTKATEAAADAATKATGAVTGAPKKKSSKVRSTTSRPAGASAAKKTPAKKATKKAPAKKVTKKAPAKKAPAKKVVKKAPAKKAPAKKASAKKAAKKSAKN